VSFCQPGGLRRKIELICEVLRRTIGKPLLFLPHPRNEQRGRSLSKPGAVKVSDAWAPQCSDSSYHLRKEGRVNTTSCHSPSDLRPVLEIIRFRATGAGLLLAITTGILAGCSSGQPQPDTKPPLVEVTTADRESIAEVVSGEAELFAYRQASLSPKITSPVYRYYVNRGQQVHKGQLLAVLENRDLAAAVKDAEGALDQAQANYTTTAAATVPQQLQKAETDLANAKANLDAQEKVYENRVVLYNKGAIAGKDLDQSLVTLTAAKTQYENTLKQLNDLKATVAKATDQSATGQLESAQAKKEAADVQLRYSELRSPIDGVVAFAIPITATSLPPVQRSLLSWTCPRSSPNCICLKPKQHALRSAILPLFR
jgi:hypothetical protein